MRVPAAYTLVRKHKVSRPGILLLNSAGKKVDFFMLKPGGGEREAARLAAFLKKHGKKKGPQQKKDQGKPKSGRGKSGKRWY